MNLEDIKKDLIAFKGNTFIYSRSRNENAEPVFFYKIMSVKEMQFIDKNPGALNAQD